ncbi:O-linked N-acetylglucosamine transferase, SPINDLY family protein [Phenylobacterium montanum]|uniref:protein O-GlcNAc transferase n=1 Tax=Phenylobacterium montanum TaxID=2823693 RepID=A0A975FXZ9_9CAUL|nr:tetratricopeptide repeat protein [Caulobacter sp. S6]QUD87231.1 tetratricopeptide repeat protein [Caulobacter sp. S6]
MTAASRPTVQDALAALQGGDLDRARALALAVTEQAPDDAFAHELLSLACYQLGDAAGGLPAAERAVMLQASAGRFANLGVLLRAVGRDHDAEMAYRHAIELDPGFVAAHHNLGNLLFDRGDMASAEIALRQALNHNADHAEAWRSLGLVLQRTGRLEEAVSAFQQLLARIPGHARGLNDLGCCLMALERYDEGLAAFQEANVRHPNYADTYGNLGALLLRAGCPFNAMLASERALELDPGQHRWMSNLATALKDLGDFDRAEALFRQALAAQPDYVVGHGNLLFCLNYHPDKPAEEIVAEYHRWDEAHAKPLLPQPLRFDNDRNPERRLRVGLVSPDFREHSARHFILPMLQGLDRERLEIVCYAEVARPDETTRQFMALADHWRSTVGLTDEDLAELIRSDQTDILIDLGGHSASSRLMVFARKPAPVQVAHMLGCGYTSGMSAMDAFLADEALAPEGAETLFVEPLLRLDRIPIAYSPPEDMPAVGPTPALARGHITFGYFGRPERINDKVLAAWSAILNGVPGSRLVLNSKAFQEETFRTLYLQRFAAFGVAPERLDLVFTTPQPKTWSAYGEIDIALDPFPHNAGTTTIEALWLGVPVLSIKDRPSVGRFGASILGAVGLSDWVADDAAGYVAKGIAAALDVPGLQALREGMRERFLASPLADGAGLGRSLSEALRGLWRDWCANDQAQNWAEAERLTRLSDQFRLQGRMAEAEAAARQAMALDPTHAGAAMHLGNALAGQSRLAEAEAAFGRALALKPDLAEAHNNRGLSYMRRGQVTAAEHDLRRAMELRPDKPEIGFNLAVVLQDQGRLEEAMAVYQTAIEARPDISQGHGAFLFCINYQPQVSAEEAFAEFQRWNRRHALPHLPDKPAHANDPDPDRRLRIGYVSPDFAAKSGRHFIEPMLAGHDRRAVEVFAYAEVAHPDAVTAYFKTLADHWRPTVGLSDDELAALIRHDRIDVLIDLGGHTAKNRLLALARKPAPVQIAHFLGHGYTSGMTAMDAFLADERLAPAGSEGLFAERVVRLPRIPIAYQAPPELPPVAPLPALAKGHVTFGHFGRTVRINERVIEAWARILNGVPGSRLMLNTGPFGDEGVRERYRQRFAAHGIDPERLDLVYTTPQPNTWAAYGAVDIALDPFPHNAGTTTIEALWLGVPVVTMADRPSVGRFGLSILHAAELDDWVAEDIDAYVARAIAAAGDLPALAELRAGLRMRMQASPLGDGPGLAHNLERVYRGLWREWCAEHGLDHGALTAKAAGLFQAGDAAGAAAIFDKLARGLGDAGSWSNLGVALKALGRTGEAEAAFREALSRDAALASAHGNLANLLTGRGLHAEALERYRSALDIEPEAAETWRAYAVCLLASGDIDAAQEAARRALALDPSRPAVHETLASALRAGGQPVAAVREYALAVAGAPDDARTLCNMAIAVQDLGRFDEAETLFRRGLAARPDYAVGHSNLLFCLNYHPDRSAEAVFAEYQRWDARHARPLASAHPVFANAKDPERRLRLGIVSPDFRGHSARHYIEPILAGLDRHELEVFCYAEVAQPDEATERFKAMADHWRSSVGLSDAALAEQIRADRIDILMDLGGHTAASRLRVFARKPAPIQVEHMLGHGYSSGLSAMDAFLADDLLAPPGAEVVFSEKLVRLPRIPLAYVAPEGMPEPGPTPALAKGYVTFGYFGRPERINDKVIAAWSRILLGVPGSRLMLNTRAFEEAECRQLYQARFAAHGVGPEQLELVFTSPQPRTWAAYGEVDIALDPFPHNAGATTIEALWLGAPVLSLKDRPSVGRFGASILGAMGLDDWVADDADAYVAKAVAAAGDLDALQALRAGMRARFLASPLADAEGLGRALGKAFRGLWRAWCGASEADLVREAIAAFGRGDHAGAVVLAERVLAIDPDHFDALQLRGAAAFRQGRLAEAEADLRAAMQLDPSRPEPAWNLIAVLRARGELEGAEAVGLSAIEASPEAPEPHNNLGSVYLDRNEASRAEACFRIAIQHRPGMADAWTNLAWTLNRLGRAAEAEAAARQSLALNPNDANSYNNLATALMHQDRLVEAGDAFQTALTKRPGFVMAHSNLLFCLNYHPSLPAEAIFAEYRRWNEVHAAPLAPSEPPAFAFGDPGRRLRIGYVSPDFRHHAVSFFIEPLLAAHDKSQVEVFCYAEVANPDAVTERFKAHADHWRSTVGLSDAEVADLVRQDGIDVLVDLAGHTAHNRLLAFARRAAPVQLAHMVGSGCTSGLTEMDGFLADEALAPVGAQVLFSEPLIRLPRIPLVYAPPEGMPQVSPLPALKKGHVTFGCFSRTARMNDDVLDLWTEILKQVPGSRLMLNAKPFQEEATREAFERRFEARGIEAERLDLVFTSPQPNTWAAYGAVDIALDPFPHNAGTTTIEALWLGVPVISLADRPPMGRFGKSILGAVGLDDWAVDTPQDYVAKAVAAAGDLKALKALRAGLRQRVEASPLRDAEGLARAMEAAYRSAWLARAGRP